MTCLNNLAGCHIRTKSVIAALTINSFGKLELKTSVTRDPRRGYAISWVYNIFTVNDTK